MKMPDFIWFLEIRYTSKLISKNGKSIDEHNTAFKTTIPFLSV